MTYYLVMVHYQDCDKEGVIFDNVKDATHAMKGNQNPCSVLADAFYESIMEDLDSEIKVSMHFSDEIDSLISKLKPPAPTKKIK